MDWFTETTRYGMYELQIFQFLGRFRYELWWSSETSRTLVGKGSEQYADFYDARYAAVLHLTTILPKAQADRLMCSQAELLWEAWPNPHGGH